MTTKYISNICIIALCLGQISWGLPTQNAANSNNAIKNTAELKSKDLCLQKTKYSETEPSDKDNSMTATTQLLKYAVSSFQQLSLNYAKRAKTISAKLLTDETLTTSKSTVMQEFKHNITQFEEKYATCVDMDELFDLVELYSNTTSFYYEIKEQELSNDSKIILGLLKKYGSKDLDNEFEKNFTVFVDNFEKKFKDLKTNLEQHKGKIAKETLEWFKTFTTLTDYDDKIAAFEKFFALYEDVWFD